MDDDVDPLLQHFQSMTRALNSCGSVAASIILSRIEERGRFPTKRDLVRRFLIADLWEARTLIHLLYRTMHALKEVNARQLEHAKTLKPGESREIQSGSEEALLMERRMELTPEATVLVKALYEWLNHIREDVKAERSLKQTVPQELWSQLERYCVFRNKLITHKATRKVHANTAVRWSNDMSKFEVMLVPIAHFPDSAVRQLTALYDKAKAHLDPTETSETNIFERMGNLYRRLDRLPGYLRAEVQTFIGHYGAISDPPEELAAFLDKFTTVIAPHLVDKESRPAGRI